MVGSARRGGSRRSDPSAPLARSAAPRRGVNLRFISGFRAEPMRRFNQWASHYDLVPLGLNQCCRRAGRSALAAPSGSGGRGVCDSVRRAYRRVTLSLHSNAPFERPGFRTAQASQHRNLRQLETPRSGRLVQSLGSWSCWIWTTSARACRPTRPEPVRMTWAERRGQRPRWPAFRN